LESKRPYTIPMGTPSAETLNKRVFIENFAILANVSLIFEMVERLVVATRKSYSTLSIHASSDDLE